jgi:hypothetical protein
MNEAFFSDLTITTTTSDGWQNTDGAPVAGLGFIQPVSGGESFSHLNLAEIVTSRLYCPVETVAEYGSIVTQAGKKYLVLCADQPYGISGTSDHKEILLSTIKARA